MKTDAMVGSFGGAPPRGGLSARARGAASAGAAALVLWLAAPPAAAQRDAAVTREDPLVGAQTGGNTERSLGLVTLTNGRFTCSGTLLAPSVVLTARHCLTDDATVGGRLARPDAVSVTASWTAVVGRGERVRDFARARPGPTPGSSVLDIPDIALLHLGRETLGRRLDERDPALLPRRLEAEDRVLQFGRGLAQFAQTVGGVPVAAVADGIYRNAVFAPTAITEDGYTFALTNGQVGHGGDSGGAGFLLGDAGQPVAITGVASACTPTGYIGPPVTAANPFSWRWVTGVSSCSYVSVEAFRANIRAEVAAARDPCGRRPVACGAAEGAASLLLAR